MLSSSPCQNRTDATTSISRDNSVLNASTTCDCKCNCNQTFLPNEPEIMSISDNKQSNTPARAPIMEETFPKNLQPTYAHQNLQFNVTRSMLRQSRPIVGNTQRLHGYLKKLHIKQCTTVLFLGGSVTDGHNAGGDKNAYPKFFVEWLNAKYPCVKKDGSPGMHEMKKTHAQNSQTHFIHWSMVSEIQEIDLVFIEFNVNDHFIKGIPHALEDKGPDYGGLNEYADCWYSETMLRRLLLLRKPDPIAIVTFSADYIGRSWATADMDPVNARQTLFRYNEEPAKLWISAMYEIPVFSASIWMLPLASKMGTALQFNDSNPYSTSNWHADRCCHPRRPGHLILSMVLAHCMLEEEKEMIGQQSDNVAVEKIERDLTYSGVMRDPIYLSLEEEALYVQNAFDEHVADIDFTDPRGDELWKGYVVSNDGWTWYADNRDNDKFGFIANCTEGGSHIALSVTGGKFGLIELSYVMSYEGFGVSLAWLDGTNDNTNQGQCIKEIKETIVSNVRTKEVEKLIAFWEETASVPTVQILKNKLEEGETKVLHICLTPHNKHVKGTENKFKLLGVRVY